MKKGSVQQNQFFARLSTKISAIVILALALSTLAAIIIMGKGNQNLIMQIHQHNSEQALSALQARVQEYLVDSQDEAQYIAQQGQISAAVAQGDVQAAEQALAGIWENYRGKINYIVVVDANAKLLASTQNGTTETNLAAQLNVKDALAGTAAAYIEQGQQTRLLAAGGAPIMDASGKVIGAVSAGYSLVDTSLVDGLKTLQGTEFTIFAGDERVNTTILDQGNRVVGTRLDAAIAGRVLEQRETYFGQADILGLPYSTAYQPIVNASGQSIGVLFAGVPIADVIAAEQRFAAIAAISVGALILVIIVGLVWMLRRMVLRPVSHMSLAAAELAQGNLQIAVNHQSKDELGRLSQALTGTVDRLQYFIGEITQHMNQMAHGDFSHSVDSDFQGDFLPIRDAIVTISDSLNQTLTTIAHSSSQVRAGAGQVADGAQLLATGATEQASAVQQLSASITEVSNKIGQTAQNVTQSTKHVTDMNQQAAASSTSMDQMVDSMQRISDSSAQIRNIIKAIDDIAFQTNILALNAAVEAARAGSAGKGFAVVAEEVRSLAGRAAKAAQSTAELIEASQTQVGQGVALAQSTRDALVHVSQSARDALDSMQRIELAATEQAEAMRQISEGVEQISHVVQANSATAQQSAATSQELAGQAEALQQEVARFKLKQATRRADISPVQHQPQPQRVALPQGGQQYLGKY